MLALRKTEDTAGLELCEVPDLPAPVAGEVKVQVAATGICGSDLSVRAWSNSYSHFMREKLPVTLGHETAGRIVAVGAGVSEGRIGERVVIDPPVACGSCAACGAGDPVGCLDRQAIGMIRDGAFAPYLLAPADSCYRLPDAIPLEFGALVEPLSVGAHALAVAEMKPGDRVLVFGPGPIGQGTAMLARALGAGEVVVLGMNDASRLQTLRRMGFDRLIDLADRGADRELRTLAGTGFDIVVDATGVPAAIDQGLSLLRPCGILAIAGMGEESAGLDVMLLVKNRLQIRGVSRIPPSAWATVLDAMEADPQAFAPMITHRMPLSKALEAFDLCARGSASKILLLPQ